MDHSESIYLIQGLFYQDRITYGIGYKPEVGEAVYCKSAVQYTLFSGVITLNANTDILEGELQDTFGNSTLTEINFSWEKLEFVKKYDGRRDTIGYVFDKKDGDIWVGTWNGARVGAGFAKCLVTAVSKDFFDPTSAAKLLGITLVGDSNPEEDVGLGFLPFNGFFE